MHTYTRSFLLRDALTHHPPSSPRRTFVSHLPVTTCPLMLSRLLIASAGSPCPRCQPIPARGGLSYPLPSLHSGSWHGVFLLSRQRQQPFVPASPGCIDMLSIEGQFTFTANQPQLHCATFFIGEPEELITIHYDFVNIDCQGGDFLKVKICKSLLSSDSWGVCCVCKGQASACAHLCVVCVCA